mmetsp:Transcript_8965/g.22500  ORF Transcript_8965/g.22500 Transcript_8965/m.22500 type:complete len:338 (-) Transcript_8965:994-2007(-)
MMTRMPAARHVLMARATSLRGGSIMPTKPRKVRSRSSSGPTLACLAGMGRMASASTRREPRAKLCRRSCSAPRTASFMGSAAPLPLVSACVQRASTASGAPLVNRMLWPLRVASTLISLRSRVKSSTAMRLNCPSQYVAQYAARSCLLSCVSALGMASNPGSPIFSASTRSATSVDSPIFSYTCLSPLYVRQLSLHRLEQMARCSTDARSAGCSTTLPVTASVMTPSGANVLPVTPYSVRHSAPLRPPPPLPPGGPAPVRVVSTTHTRVADIMLVVSVPVLSEQMTLVHPRVSTDGSERTMAFCFAILRVPSARHVVTTAGSPSGMAATARATAILK